MAALVVAVGAEGMEVEVVMKVVAQMGEVEEGEVEGVTAGELVVGVQG